MTFTAPPTANPNDKLPASWWNTYVRDNGDHLYSEQPDWLKIARLSSNFVKNNDQVHSDVTGLSFAIAANEIWVVAFEIFFNSPSAADIKFRPTVPSGASGRQGFSCQDNSVSRILDGGGIGAVSQGDDQALIYHVLVRNGANAGTVQLQSAQLTATASDTTIYANSGLIAVRFF